jgi:hypothetical protein
VSEEGQEQKTIVTTNRVNVRLDKTRLVITNPNSQLEHSNIRLSHIQALNIPLSWLHERKALCLQVIYSQLIEFPII